MWSDKNFTRSEITDSSFSEDDKQFFLLYTDKIESDKDSASFPIGVGKYNYLPLYGYSKDFKDFNFLS
jgi:hypothetical protein